MRKSENSFLAQSTCWSPGTLLLLRCQRKLEPGFYLWSQVFYTSGIRGISYMGIQDFLSDLHLRNLMNNELDSSSIFLFEMLILPLGKKVRIYFTFDCLYFVIPEEKNKLLAYIVSDIKHTSWGYKRQYSEESFSSCNPCIFFLVCSFLLNIFLFLQMLTAQEAWI